MSMNSAVASGPLTSNTLLFQKASYLKSVLVLAGGNVSIYDGVDATGKEIFECDNSAGTAPLFFDFSHMVQAKNGLYVAVAAGSVHVYYN